MAEAKGAASPMRRRRGLSVVVLCGALMVAGCDGSLSEAQLAYNACTDANNETFRFLPGNRAIVSGVTGGTEQCFWSWNANSVEDAQNQAMANCQEKMERCFVFATNNGFSGWVQRISDNGGRDPGNGGSGSDGGSDLSFGDFLGVTSAILGGVAGATGGGGFRGGGGGGIRSSGANTAQCQQYLNLAEQCRQRQQNMGSLGSSGLGTSGQAGSFNDCYNLYMNAYNASCR